MNNPQLSVIIPIYGVEERIEKCAISLFEQTFQEIEYIFVNDCTPDNSIFILNKIIEKYPKRKENIILINHQQNKGVSAARLTGLNIATGEYIIHCDSDDWVEPNMYELMINKAKEEKADIVCAGLFYDNGEKVSIDTFSSHISSMTKMDYLSKIPLGGKYSSLCNKLIKRELYFSNNVFPIQGISMWEDMVVTYRLVYYSKKISIIPTPLYHYIHKNNSISSPQTYNENNVKQQIECAQFIENFFKNKEINEYKKYNLLIQFLKFASKAPYLMNKNIRDLKSWQNIFPETHKYIMEYTEISFLSKLNYLLACTPFIKISAKIFDIYNSIKQNNLIIKKYIGDRTKKVNK